MSSRFSLKAKQIRKQIFRIITLTTNKNGRSGELRPRYNRNLNKHLHCNTHQKQKIAFLSLLLLQRRLSDGGWWLISENENYDPIPIKPSDDFRVLGEYSLRLTKD